MKCKICGKSPKQYLDLYDERIATTSNNGKTLNIQEFIICDNKKCIYKWAKQKYDTHRILKLKKQKFSTDINAEREEK